MARDATGYVTQKIDKKTGNKFWVARWKDANRKLREKKCRNKTEALRLAHANTLEISAVRGDVEAVAKKERLEQADKLYRWGGVLRLHSAAV